MDTVTPTKLSPASGTYQPKGMLIGGKWVGSVSGKVITIENPGKKTSIAEVPHAGAADVELAVTAAEKAFPSWKNVVPRERGKLLLKIAEAMEARVEEMARTIAMETGNALRTQARGEAKLAADIFRYFGGLASELKGETVPLGEQRAVLYAPRADRHRGRHHPVERAGHAGRAQDRARALRRQRAGDEGGRGRAARRCC